MAVVSSWDEYNGGAAYATPSVSGISETHWGSVDSAELDPLAYPINNGENSYEKYHALRFSGFTGPESVDNFRLYGEWLTGAGELVDRRFEDNGDRIYFKDTGGKVTAGPSTTATVGSSLLPASVPGVSNIGGGPVTSNGDGTNVFITQVRVAAASFHYGGGCTLYMTFDITE